MALTWVEDGNSRSATIYRLGRRDPSTRVRVFNVFGTSDEDVVHADINTKISTTYPYWTYPGQPLVKLRSESYSVDYQGDIAWKVSINYSNMGADDPAATGPLKRARNFDTTGGTQHVTNAKRSLLTYGDRRYGPSGENDCADMKGAIGVDDNSVNGVDIVVPMLKWTETYDVPAKYVTNTFIRNLAKITGTVNTTTFRGFDAREVLFVGCQGGHDWDAQKGDGPWSLSYQFVASPNAGNDGTIDALKIGDIEDIRKDGHEYLWVRYASEVDSGKQQVIRVPLAVYVDKVYEDGDFSLLGIGA